MLGGWKFYNIIEIIMAALNDKQAKELCRKIEQRILKNGYFIFDVNDWDSLSIGYRSVVYGKAYEDADYTEITINFDNYNITDKLQVRYFFIKSVWSERTGDSFKVYYNKKNGEIDGGRPYSMDTAAEFIANRFIELVEDKIINKELEARISKLEKLLMKEAEIKNEFLGLGKPKQSDEDEFVNRLFSKYPTIRKALTYKLSNKNPDEPFNAVLSSDSDHDNIYFVVGTDDGRNDMYCTVYDSNNVRLGSIKNLSLTDDVNKIANFMLQYIIENTVTESKRRVYESVPLTQFDCETINKLLNKEFKDKLGYSTDYADDNSDYGFLNIGIYDDKGEYITDYDIEVEEPNKIAISTDNREVGTANSFKQCAEKIFKDFEKNN